MAILYLLTTSTESHIHSSIPGTVYSTRYRMDVKRDVGDGKGQSSTPS
jgi:hypothetical protein